MVNLVFRKRWFILALVLIAFTASSLSSLRLNPTQQLMDLLPKHGKEVLEYKQILEKFPALAEVVFAVKRTSFQNDEISAQDQLLVKEVAQQLHSSGLFDRVTEKIDFNFDSKIQSSLMDEASRLFDEVDEADLSHKLNASNLRQSYLRSVDALTTSPMPFSLTQMNHDPLGLRDFVWKKFFGFAKTKFQAQILDGFLLGADPKFILIFAAAKKSSSDSFFSERLVSEALNLEAFVRQKFNTDFHFFSSHRIAAENSRIIRSDVEFASTFSLVLLLLLAMLIFRRRWLPILTVVPLVFGASCVAGVMVLFDRQPSMLALGCASVIFGVAIDYGIHVLYHFDSIEIPSEDHLFATATKLLRPLLLSCLTTSTAFGVLFFSSIPVYRDLGLMTIVGLLSSLIFVISMIPFLKVFFKQNNRRSVVDANCLFPTAIKLIHQKENVAIVTILILTLLLGAGLFRLKMEQSMEDFTFLSSKGRQDQKLFSELTENPSYTSRVIVGVSGYQLEEALKKNEMVYRQLASGPLAKLLNGPLQSVAKIFPSNSMQDDNFNRWSQFWNPDRFKIVRELVSDPQLGLTGIVEQNLVASVKNQPSRIDLLFWKASPLSELLDLFINSNNTDGKTWVFSTGFLREGLSFNLIKESLKNSVADVVVVNPPAFIRQMVSAAHHELLFLSGLMLIISGVVIGLTLGWKRAFFLNSLMVLGVLWTFGALGWLGIHLNIITGFCGLFVFGLVIDYSIFLSEATRFQSVNNDTENEFLNRSFAAILVSALTTIVGVIVLIAAEHPVLRQIGITISIGTTSAILILTTMIPQKRFRHF